MEELKIVQALYLFLPAFAANMAAVYKKVLPDLDRPINEPWFGKNKTWRGVVVGTMAGMLTITLQRLLYEASVFERLSLLAYDELPWLAVGAALGFGALMGDLAKSFVKRRLNKKPGAPWFPWDQIDEVLGSWFFLTIWYSPPAEIVAIALIAVTLGTPLVNRFAHHLGLKRVPW